MTSRTYTLMLLATLANFLFFSCSSSNGTTAAKKEAAPVTQMDQLPGMELAAIAFLESLEDDKKAKAVYPFENSERKNWHYVPLVRGGLPLREMSEPQKSLAMKLLKSCLSQQGEKKAEGIIQLERVLQILENHPVENDRRHPELYYVAIFGDPGAEDPWGWRFEGHHLSLNFSSVDRRLAVTPAFFGSNPAIVRSTEYEGTEVLKAEQWLGRELVKMLSAEQAKKAILADPAPNDIVTLVQEKVDLKTYSGLAAREMNESQKAKLEELLAAYLNNMEPEVADGHWEKLRESGLDKVHFAWMGDTEPGARHYYRIHGPTLLVEYDNVQNGANHIHTVWRDLTNDFGEDLLREHYAHGHKH